MDVTAKLTVKFWEFQVDTKNDALAAWKYHQGHHMGNPRPSAFDSGFFESYNLLTDY